MMIMGSLFLSGGISSYQMTQEFLDAIWHNFKEEDKAEIGNLLNSFIIT